MLILEDDKDQKHLMRVTSLIKGKNLDIKVWTITKDAIKQARPWQYSSTDQMLFYDTAWTEFLGTWLEDTGA